MSGSLLIPGANTNPVETHTDCRSEDGHTVALIDAVGAICQVIKDRDLSAAETREALNDLTWNEGFIYLTDALIALPKED